MTPPPTPAPRKPYQPPRLAIYGSVVDLTRSKSLIGMVDGGILQMTRS